MIRKGLFFEIAFLGLILILSFVNLESQSNTELYLNISSRIHSDSDIQFTPHSPIIIDGNAEFNDAANAEGWSGNGSKSSPYVIEGLEITATGTEALVEIKNTNVHFKLFNNIFEGNSETIDVIVLRSVSNGTILNNVVKNCHFSGISLFRSTYNEILGNNILECGKAPRSTVELWPDIGGIYLQLSDTNNITNNVVKKNHVFGISLSRSSNNFISKNNLSQQFYAIGILDISYLNVISENMIVGNTHAGVCFYQGLPYNNLVKDNVFDSNSEGLWLTGHNNTASYNIFYENPIAITLGMDIPGNPPFATECNITNNLVYNNSLAIFLQFATDNNIFHNSIFTNNGYGIDITNNSSNNTIKWNDFIKNNVGGSSQANDNGKNNEFASNYWWTSSTKAYSINGETNNADSSPLTSKFNPDSPEIPESKASSGWSIFLFFPVIFTYVILRKTKKR